VIRDALESAAAPARTETKPLSPATLAARAAVASDREHAAVMPPLHLSANYAFDGFGKKRRYDYSRTSNPTRDHLCEAIAQLEGGAGAVVTSSGMSAVALVLDLLPPNALVVAPHDGYGGTWRLLSARERQGRLRVQFVDLRDATARRRAFAERPGLVWIETPSNPLLRVTDIELVAREAHAAGALVACDNTFLSPWLQRPLALGCDVVVHSTTKYLNGHSDVVGGAVTALDEARVRDLAWWANCTGVTGAPFDSYLTLRGMRTLGLRMERAAANAGELARRLERHRRVARVHYPGLASHADHELARRQQSGFGAMLSFELAAADSVGPFVESLACFTLAESLGGVESLVAHPATMTHAAMSAEARERAGITDALVRLSNGIEDVEDLWRDLDAALSRRIAGGGPS
jgi:cystathionine gamma-synthase